MINKYVRHDRKKHDPTGARRDIAAYEAGRPLTSPIRALLDVITKGIEPEAVTPADLACLRRNCLLPLYRMVTRGADDWFDQVGIPWQGDVLMAKLLYQSQAELLRDLLARLPNTVPPVVLLKGMSFAQTLYPSPYSRPMRDMDILIERPFVEVVESVLRELGFEQRSTHDQSYYDEMHHTMPFVHPERNVWVEVHTRLFPPASPLSSLSVFEVDSVFAQTRLERFGDEPIRLLSAELQFLYLIGHWSETFHDVGGIIGILDCLFLLQKHPDLDWYWILSRLSDPQLAEYVWLMMTLLQENGWWSFDPDFRTAVRKQLRPGYPVVAAVQRRICEAYYVDGRMPGRVLTLSNLATLWNTLRLDCSPWLRILQVPVNFLFPPDRTERFRPGFLWSRFRRFLFSR